jgi:hypothetical protein
LLLSDYLAASGRSFRFDIARRSAIFLSSRIMWLLAMSRVDWHELAGDLSYRPHPPAAANVAAEAKYV